MRWLPVFIILATNFVWAQSPPPTRKSEPSDQQHNVYVPDLYRWLEKDSEERAHWVDQQNEYTQNFFRASESYDQILADLKHHVTSFDPTRFRQMGDFGFYQKYNPGDERRSLYITDAYFQQDGELLVDPTNFGSGLHSHISFFQISPNKQFLVFGISENGSDVSTGYVMNLMTREVLPKPVPQINFGFIEWRGSQSFDYYKHSPNPTNRKNGVFYRRNIGSQLPDKESKESSIIRLQNNQWEIRKTDVFQARRVGAPSWGGGFEFHREALKYVGSIGSQFFFLNKKPNNFEILMKDFSDVRDSSSPQKLIGESHFAIKELFVLNNYLVVNSSFHGDSVLTLYSKDGTPLNHAPLPLKKSIVVTKVYQGHEDHQILIEFSGPLNPWKLIEWDVLENSTKTLFEVKPKVNLEDYHIEDVHFPSKDGTEVPITLVYKKGLQKDRNNSAIITGYGGFRVNVENYYRSSLFPFLDQGGVFAQINLRGGLEYGNKWHEQGRLLNKVNVFKDFIAGTEFLIQSGYTQPQLIGIRGGSNGGLLVGAVTNMRPDLFGVACPEVGVMDMIRYKAIDNAWTDEYGDPETPKFFDYLYRYSPYHNIKPDTQYPILLVETSIGDDRVLPSHSYKYAARAQELLSPSGQQVFLHSQENTGHGAGFPLSKYLEQEARFMDLVLKKLPHKVME